MQLQKDTLENLFRLSNFHFNQSKIDEWHRDLDQWLTFFALPKHAASPVAYQFAGKTFVDALRQDEQAGVSLSSAEIKLFSKRFVDGFIALPEHQSRS